MGDNRDWQGLWKIKICIEGQVGGNHPALVDCSYERM